MKHQPLVSIRAIARRMKLDRRSIREYASQLGYEWRYEKTEDSMHQKAACLSSSQAEGLVRDMKRLQEKRDEGHEQTIKLLRRELRETEEERARLSLELDAIRTGARQEAPRWLGVPESTKEHHAIMVLMLSDLHLGEVVNSKEVYGYNTYNPEIAEIRLKNIGDHAIMVCRDYFAASSKLKIDGCVVMMAGDLISGTIHDELIATNAETSMESIVHFSPIIAEEIIGKLHEEFRFVHCLSVAGNHDRFGRKVSAKHTATSAASWVISKWIADRFRGNTEVTFDISEAANARHQIYSTRFILAHGDEFRGGDGQVGAYGPVRRGALRKSMRDVKLGQPHDIMCIGHWHQYLSAPSQGVIMTGCMKGFDEFSARLNFTPEPPSQALFLVTPEWGVSFSCPIFANRHNDL